MITKDYNYVSFILDEIEKNLQMNKSQLADALGISRQSVNSWVVRGKISKKVKYRLTNDYGISLHFLETGEGDFYEKEPKRPIESNAAMYKPDISMESLYNAMQTNALPPNITHIPQAAEAGIVGGTFDPVRNDEVVRWAIPGLYGGCYSFIVKGDSMEATLVEGEILITKSEPITDINDVDNDYIYAVVTKDNVLVKRVNRHSDNEYIWLISDNEEYDMIEIHFSEIVALYKGRIILKHQLDQKLRYE